MVLALAIALILLLLLLAYTRGFLSNSQTPMPGRPIAYSKHPFLRQFTRRELRKADGYGRKNVLSCDLVIPLHEAVQGLEDIEGFSNAALLASQILETKKILQFFDAIERMNSSKWEDKRYLRLKGSGLTREEESHITQSLKEFGSTNLKWLISKNLKPDELAGTASDEGNAIIGINTVFKDLLRNDSNHSSAEKMFVSFSLVVSILHELAHAFNIVTRWKLDGKVASEPWFEDQHFTELGHALITHLFGGCIVFRFSADVNAGLRELMRYGLQIEHLYDDFDSKYWYRVRWRCHRQYIVRWVVSMSWIEKLFTQAFWNGEHMTKGAHALIVPKRLGLRTQSPIWLNWVKAQGSTGYTDGMNARDPSMERDDDYQIWEGIVRRDGHVDPGFQGESEDDYSEDGADEQAQDGADENDTERGSGARVADE